MKYILILSMLWCSAFCSGQRSEYIHYSGTDMTKSRGYHPIGKSDTIPIDAPDSTVGYVNKIMYDSSIYSLGGGILVDIIPIKAGKGIIMSDTIINGIAAKVFTVDTSYKVETDTIINNRGDVVILPTDSIWILVDTLLSFGEEIDDVLIIKNTKPYDTLVYIASGSDGSFYYDTIYVDTSYTKALMAWDSAIDWSEAHPLGAFDYHPMKADTIPAQNIEWKDTVYTDPKDPNIYQRGGWAEQDSKGKIVDSVITYFLLPDFELVNKYIIYSYRNVPEFGVYYYEGIVSRAEEWNVFKSAVFFNREIMFEYVELRYHDGGSFATHCINRKLIDRAIKKY